MLSRLDKKSSAEPAVTSDNLQHLPRNEGPADRSEERADAL